MGSIKGRRGESRKPASNRNASILTNLYKLPQARDVDFNSVFADCFNASEMDSLFSSGEHEVQNMAAYFDGEDDIEKPSLS